MEHAGTRPHFGKEGRLKPEQDLPVRETGEIVFCKRQKAVQEHDVVQFDLYPRFHQIFVGPVLRNQKNIARLKRNRRPVHIVQSSSAPDEDQFVEPVGVRRHAAVGEPQDAERIDRPGEKNRFRAGI